MINEEEIDDLDDIFTNDDANVDNNNEQENNDEGTTADVATIDEFGENVPAPKKRVVRNPRLKFDPDRLCGSRGIPILADHFKDVKFKGKGHELEDLSRLLATLEHWTHRLFPSMKFEETLQQIERLGKKKPVQVCVQKLRLGLPILNTDFVREESEEEDNVVRGDLVVPEETPVSAFDNLLEAHRESTTASSDVEMIDIAPPPKTLTEDQELRMKQNRELAAERRRLKVAENALVESLPSTSKVLDFTDGDDVLVDSSAFLNEDEIQPSMKAAKRPRVLSDSEDDCDIDALVDNTLGDESN